MCLTGTESRSPGSQPRVNGGVGVLDHESTWRQTKRNPSFGSSAPGSRPASQRTWKPLQIPSTGPPAPGELATAPIAGEKRAIAPARR